MFFNELQVFVDYATLLRKKANNSNLVQVNNIIQYATNNSIDPTECLGEDYDFLFDVLPDFYTDLFNMCFNDKLAKSNNDFDSITSEMISFVNDATMSIQNDLLRCSRDDLVCIKAVQDELDFQAAVLRQYITGKLKDILVRINQLPEAAADCADLNNVRFIQNSDFILNIFSSCIANKNNGN